MVWLCSSSDGEAACKAWNALGKGRSAQQVHSKVGMQWRHGGRAVLGEGEREPSMVCVRVYPTT